MFYRMNKDENYTKVSNEYLKDKDLSLKAKGLFTIILSLPDSWNFSNEGLCSLCKEGKVAVDSAIKELKLKGYIKLTKRQKEDGKFYYDYDIYEKLDMPLGNIAFPFMDNQR